VSLSRAGAELRRDFSWREVAPAIGNLKSEIGNLKSKIS
jgi:hypothetical protein